MEFILGGLAFALAACAIICAIRADKWKDTAKRLEAEHAAALEKAKKEAKEPTYDCRELLHDLTEGAALVKITRISPLDVYVRRN